METAIINITLISLVVLAIYTIVTPRIRKSIILLAILSVTASFAYSLLSAPDIALAEAVIGSTLSTVIFLVSIKKSKIFIVYYLKTKEDIRQDVIKVIEQTLTEDEYELQFVCTSESLDFLKENYSFELLIKEVDDKLELYGEPTNLGYADIVKDLKRQFGEEAILDKNIHRLEGL